jgi:outer membrane receptor protein involved in Fe transport
MLIAGFAGSLENVDADTIFGLHTGRGGAAYVQDEIALLEPVRVTLGGRFDYQQLGNLESVSQFNPKLGLVYRLPDSSAVRFSAGRGFRAPSVAEVFTTSTAGGVVILPNPDLTPERSWSLDLGGSRTFSPSLHGDISIFRNEFWDLIEPAFGSDGVVHFQNITRALIYGTELTMNLNLLGGSVQSQVSYTYMVPRDVTTGEILKYRPRNLLYVSTQFSEHPFRLGVDLRILSRTEQIDDQFVTLGIIPQGDRRVPIYVADLRLGAVWSIAGLPMTSSLQINNLFQYYYVELIGNMAPTRNFVFTVETRI